MDRNKIIIVAITVIVIFSGLISFSLLYSIPEKNTPIDEKTQAGNPTSTTQDGQGQTSLGTGEKATPTSTLKAGEDMNTSSISYTDLPNDLFSEDFTWQKPEEIAKQGMVVENFSPCGEYLDMGCEWYLESDTTYLQIAKFSYKQQTGSIFFIRSLGYPELGTGYKRDYFFVNFDNRITLLEKNGAQLNNTDSLNKLKFFVDKNLLLPTNVAAPKILDVKGKQKLYLENEYEETILSGGTKIAFSDNKDIWDFDDFFVTYTNNIEGIQPVKYNIRLPKIFNLDNNKKYNIDTYDSTRISGCGGRTIDIISKSKESGLEKIGKADDGNIIYKFTNISEGSEENELLNNYNGYQENTNQPTTTFDKFLATNPIIIMKDGFDRYIKFTKKDYLVNLAECGKPVIYLYPTKDTKVNVQVKPNGGLTKVDPFYPTNGWLVNAKPNGELTNTDGQNYPYLFWEGNAYDMKVPSEGFVLSRENIKRDMTKLLAKLGLNQKETSDFLEFWQIKLEEKPYVFVTFVSQTDFDKVAPLNISPRPDKTIRVFMDYQPLDVRYSVRPLKIETPTRTGFTVVEWGGRLHQ